MNMLLIWINIRERKLKEKRETKRKEEKWKSEVEIDGNSEQPRGV